MEDKLIERVMQRQLQSAIKVFPIITLCGPRQSGKTTLTRMAFPEMPYVNLEDISSRTFATEDPKGFIMQFEDGAIIDEAQLVPSLFGQLQAIVDEDKFKGKNNRRFILTGSSNFALQPSLRQSLAGRTAIFTLLPLSTAEIIAAKTGDVSADKFILSGGYPGVWMQDFQYRRQIIENYINTYVERDVRRLMEVKDLHKFATFLRLCASRIGTELNKSSLAVEIGTSVPTIDSWLSLLEASFVIYLLQPWYKNIGKRLVKSPKLYFCDTSIACSLLGINDEEQLKDHYLRGALFENMVINNVRKYILNQGYVEHIYFYRDKSGREVDLIWETTTGLRAYEVKSGMTYHADYFKHVNYLKGLLGDNLAASGLVYCGDEELIKLDNAVINYRSFPDKFKVQL